MSEKAAKPRAWGVATAAVVLLAAIAGVVVLIQSTAYRGWIEEHGGCATRWPGDAQNWPYGDVRSCRPLDRKAHVFGSVDVTAYVLLATSSGEVVLKIDYSDVHLGRQYVSKASEVGADDARWLSSNQRRTLEQDITARGGVRPQPLTLNYGDG